MKVMKNFLTKLHVLHGSNIFDVFKFIFFGSDYAGLDN